MEETILKVDGMTCNHCASAVTKAVGALEGVSEVTVDLAGRTVIIRHNTSLVSPEKIRSEIEDKGYDIIL